MKKKALYPLALVVCLLLVGVSALACAGPPGPQGEPGVAGTMYGCADCHDADEELKAKQVQYAASTHATGGNFERSSESCAICHTSEGFRQRLEAGTSEDLAAAIENPTPQNCRTCHKIHETYTTDDWALRVTAAITLELTGTAYNQGDGNLCATCHQPRWSYDQPVVGGDDVTITSPDWGPHYGPQSAILTGVAGYGNFTRSSVHYTAITDGCPVCHMADAYGDQAGGHTWNMEYEYNGHDVANDAGCESCHDMSNVDGFDRNGVQTDIEAKIAALKAALLANNLVTADDHTVPGTYTAAEAGALWNYLLVLEDRSDGIHNPQYVEFLLDTALAALQ